MSKRTFPLIAVLALSTAFAVTFVSALSRSAKTPASANGISNYWQRRQAARFGVSRVGSDTHSADYAAHHPGLSIPATGQVSTSPTQGLDLTHSNFYERERAEMVAGPGVDTTDDAARQPELNASSARQVDLKDYYFYMPELSASLAGQVDLTDYYFRQLSLGAVSPTGAVIRNASGISPIMIGVNSGADECRMRLPGRYGAGPPYKTPAC